MTEFERIYNDYFRDVYLYIKSLSKDEQVAQDITSETFMKAIQSVDKFNCSCDIRVLLCQIAKNSYFSYLRKNNKVVLVDQISEKENGFDIEQRMESKETSMKIHQVIHALDEPYKEVFSLRTFGELSFKEIGLLFQKSENWDCVTYHRARKKIKEKWRAINED